MPSFERICPKCGTSNSFNRRNCVKCRAPLTRMAIPQIPPPAAFSRRGMARLAWKATKFLTRTGFNLAKRGAKSGIERVEQQRKAQAIRNETIDAEYRLREWRAGGAASDKAEPPKSEGV